MKDAKTSEALDRYARWTDGPLMVLAVLMIPLLLGPVLFRLAEGVEATFTIADWFIWAIFAADYVVRLYLAPAKWRFVRSHVPDLIVVVVPFLRPLRVLRSARVLRLLRLARLAAFLARGLRDARRVLTTRGVNYVLLIVVALVFLSAALVVEVEKGVAGANIKTFTDGLWWAATTVTTVGYGDRFPMSPAGRGIAVVLMVAGIALFGVLTAAIAAFFVEGAAKEEPGQQAGSNFQLEQIIVRLDRIEARLNSSAAVESRRDGGD